MLCSRSEADVHNLIAGPSVSNCDGCVECCVDVLTKEPAVDARSARIARRQDKEQDTVVELMPDAGLATLLETQLSAHAELDPTMRAALRVAIARLRRG